MTDVPAPRLAEDPCVPASPRVPVVFSDLDWVVSAAPTQRVFAGEVAGGGGEPAYNDPDAAGAIWLQLREIDLDQDGDCDLVGRALASLSSGGDAEGYLVFWFADPQGWRRVGADWGERAAELSPAARELLAPDNPQDMARFGYGSYLPARVAGGEVVLLARARPGRDSGEVPGLHVIRFDRATRGVSDPEAATPLLSPLENLARKACDEGNSAADACAAW